jgi:hypothetical protein
MKKGFLVFALFILVFSGFSIAEEIYDSIPIQIQVLNDAGAATTGTFTFKIEISNSVTCSPILYTNTTTLTTDSRGVVSYNLINVNLPFDEQYWFCYYRDGVLKSTIKSARVPYAFSAKNISSSGINVNSNLQDLNSSTGSASTVSGVPAGMIAPFNLTECPTGWTLANGSNGTPDLRGIFIRGSGTNSILKYANGSYFSSTYGSYKKDSLQGHIHSPTDNSIGGGIALIGSDGLNRYVPQGGVNIGNPANDGTNGVPRTGAETSPAYYSTIYCVKTTEDSATSNSIWGVTGNYISVQNTSKNVGIGTSSPSSKLHVGGNVNITGNLSLGAGQIFYNSSANKYYYYNTTDWVEIGSGASSSNYINPIVESGNNSNGYYIKFIDGTMMAWGNVTTTGSLTGSVSFPANFSDQSSIKMTSSNLPYATNNFCEVYPQNNFYYAHYGTNLNICQWHAIGKWSNTPYNTSTITVGGGIPAGAIVAYNRTSCPVGWVLADGSSGTPDLRGIFIRGSGTSSILKYANGTYFSSVLGTYKNDSFQGFALSDAITGQLKRYSIGNPLDDDAAPVATVALGGGLTGAVLPNANDGTNGIPRTGAETTPAYYSTIYCVKTTEDSATSNTIWATSGNNVLLNNNSMNVNISNSKVRATRTSSQTIPSGVGTAIVYNGEVYDTLGEFNTSNGRFTATQSGYYAVNVHVFFSTGSFAAGQQINCDLLKNGVGHSTIFHHIMEGSTNNYFSGQGSALVYLNAGDFLTVAVAQYTGGDKTIYGDGYYNYFEIIRIP